MPVFEELRTQEEIDRVVADDEEQEILELMERGSDIDVVLKFMGSPVLDRILEAEIGDDGVIV